MILISQPFFVMMYWLIYTFGDIGKLFGILLLIIQVSSSVGIFPIEIAPKAFSSISPLIPIKYSINILKEGFGGYNNHTFNEIHLILLGILISFTTITLLTIALKNHIQKKFTFSNPENIS